MQERGSAPRIFAAPGDWPPVDGARLSGVLRRRILAYVVDFFLVAAIWFVAAIGLGVATVLTLGLLSPTLALLAAVPIAYHTLAVAALGATPGQRLLGLEVRDMSLAPPTLLQAFIQSAIFLLTVPTTAGLVLLAVFFLPRRRTLHDLLANLQVLRRAPRDGEILLAGGQR